MRSMMYTGRPYCLPRAPAAVSSRVLTNNSCCSCCAGATFGSKWPFCATAAARLVARSAARVFWRATIFAAGFFTFVLLIAVVVDLVW